MLQRQECHDKNRAVMGSDPMKCGYMLWVIMDQKKFSSLNLKGKTVKSGAIQTRGGGIFM